MTSPKILTLEELMNLDLPQPRWAVPDVIPEGLSILAGKQKLGKSWLAMGLSISVASGGYVMGQIKVQEGDVLYLALEDSAKRLQSRFGNQLAGSSSVPAGRLHVARQWPRGKEGAAAIEAWLKEHREARLVIVDTLAKFRARAKNGTRGYDDDYSDLEPLQQLAIRFQVAIVVVHHVRKLGADDWTDTLNATTGLGAAADGLLGLFRTRGDSKAVLKVTGRDLDEQELGLRFDATTCSWTMLGDAALTVGISSQRQSIIDLLKESGPMQPAVIAKALMRNVSTVKTTVQDMAKDGQLVADGGIYAVPSRA